jgi:cell division protein FtsA
MKKSNFVLVFDIGSSKVRAVVAGRGLNGTFNVRGLKEVEYDGFYEGEFLDKEKIYPIFEGVIAEFKAYLDRIDKAYIGVPAEFSSVVTTEVAFNFGERRKVKKADIDSLQYMAGEKAKNANVEVVSVSAVEYVIDGRTTLSPIGERGSSITGKLSVVYANKEFIDIFNAIVGGLGFSAVEYISEPLAQAHFVIPAEKKEDLALLIDSGDLTTSIALVKGEGLMLLTSFSRGGGFITNDLSEAFNLSMGEAERLKQQVVLSLKGKQTDCYHLTTDLGTTIKITLNEANEVVGYRIEELAEVISKCLQLHNQQFASYLPVYLTGGGISKLKGGRDFLAKCLGRNIAYGVPPLPGKEKAELASLYSLVSVALNSLESGER